MKSPQICFSLVVAAAFSLSPILALEPVATWEGADLSVRSADVVWPDAKGSHDLKGQTVGGITEGKKDGVGSASKTVEFNGEQSVPLRTVNPFPSVLQDLQIEMVMSLAESSVEEMGTVVRMGTQWEIRADYKRKGLSFIVWHDKDHYTHVFLPVRPGEWVNLTATMAEGALRLKIDEAEEETPLKGELRVEETPVPLAVGATKGRPQDGSEYRPFTGAIQSLKVSM
ncbi:MAG: hypothetical protein SFU53_15725 [Terrimicrobiaceae bacterium]|nr:hypothetical protein [Terrimicrobiaceae bacterium]